jgi:hypothetical protein
MPENEEYEPTLPARLVELGGRPIEHGSPGAGEGPNHVENATSFVATIDRAFKRGPDLVDMLADIAEDPDQEPKYRIRAAQIVIDTVAKMAGKAEEDAGAGELSALEELVERAKAEKA